MSIGVKDRSVSLVPHHLWDHLRSALDDCRSMARPWSGVVYRFAPAKFAARHLLLNGQGSRINGARWTPRSVEGTSAEAVQMDPLKLLMESFPTVYTCREPETGAAELLYYRDLVFPGTKATDRFWENYRFAEVHANLSNVLDLQQEDILGRLNVKMDRLLAEWEHDQNRGVEAFTQAVGRAAHLAGLEGLLFRSARRPGGVNLATFPLHYFNRGTRIHLKPDKIGPVPADLRNRP